MDIYRCIGKNKDINGNVISYKLMDAYNASGIISVSDLKKALKNGNMLVTNLRISDKGNIIGTEEFTGDKHGLYIADVKYNNGVALSVLVVNHMTGHASTQSISALEEAIEKKFKIYGYHKDCLEIFNPWAADMADLNVGTPVIFRDSADRVWQTIYLGYGYSKEFGETRFRFFDGETPDTGYYEIGASQLVPMTMATEVGILSKLEIDKLKKNLLARGIKKEITDTTDKFKGTLKRWRKPKKNNWIKNM